MSWCRRVKMGKFCVLACLLVATSGCSIKFAYNNADRLVRWQVGEYLDLDREQKKYLQQEVAELIAWHRSNHLPSYSAYLYGLSNQFSDGVTTAQLEEVFAQMYVWGEEVESRGMPSAITLLSSLSDKQVAALPEKLAQSNVEIAEKELEVPLLEVQADWAKGFEDALERFTGRLDREQRAYLKRRASAYQPERVLWAEYRARWQTDMMQLLEQRKDVDAFANGFRALVAARESYYSEEYSQINEHNLQLSREIAAHLLSNLSEKQSERFRDSLQDLAEDFKELAAQA